MRGPIHDTVDRHGSNHRHDVMSIQLLLNNARFGDQPELAVDGICGPRTLAAIASYQQHEFYGMYTDPVTSPGSATIDSLLRVSSVKHRAVVKQVHQVQKLQSPNAYPVANVDDLAPHPRNLHEALKTPEAHLASSGRTGHKYTDSPLEVPRIGTTFDPLTLPGMVQKAWPELNKAGARTMTAQSMGETTNAKALWNYNLGNLKCSGPQRATRLHTYQAGTWEYWSAEYVQDIMRKNKNVRYATAEEIKKKVGTESGGKRMVVIKPPDLITCFLAFPTLSDGITGWTDYFKVRAKKHSDLVQKLNTSECAAVARIMHEERYYSQNEADYARVMKKNVAYLDRVLG